MKTGAERQNLKENVVPGGEVGRHCIQLLRVVSDSLRPHGLQPVRLVCTQNSPGKNSGVDWHSLLQRSVLSQGLNPGLLHCRWILYHLSHQGSPGRYWACVHNFGLDPKSKGTRKPSKCFQSKGDIIRPSLTLEVQLKSDHLPTPSAASLF